MKEGEALAATDDARLVFGKERGKFVVGRTGRLGIRSGLCERSVLGNRYHIAFAELVGKYQFDEPVLDEFIGSGFEDFSDFAMLIAKDMYDEDDPEQPE